MRSLCKGLVSVPSHVSGRAIHNIADAYSARPYRFGDPDHPVRLRSCQKDAQIDYGVKGWANSVLLCFSYYITRCSSNPQRSAAEISSLLLTGKNIPEAIRKKTPIYSDKIDKNMDTRCKNKTIY